MTLQIATANRLWDGAVVYLGPKGEWTESLGLGDVARDADAADRLLATAERAVAGRIVVAPYLIEVAEGHGAMRPSRLREEIRANGPTVRPDFSRVAWEG